MGSFVGTGIVRDGLVFGYDTGYGLEYLDEYRSYKGRPSTNYIAFQNALPQSSYTTYVHTAGTWANNHPFAIRAYNAQGNEITGYVNTGVSSGDYTPYQPAHWQYDNTLKKPVVVSVAKDSSWKAKSFGAQMGAWDTLSMAAGSKYVISWLQWTSDLNLCADAGFYSKNTSNSNGFHDGRSGGNAKNTKLNTWQRVHHVYTVSSNRNLSNSYGSVYMYTHTQSNIDGVIKIADVQLELNTEYPSAFITQPSNERTGSRSNTECLLDLTGNATITLDTVSFDTEGQISFDGTSDHIDLPTLDNDSGEVTVEVMFKQETSTGDDRILLNNQWWGPYAMWMRETDQRLYWITGTSSSSRTTLSATGHTVGNWYHAVGVRRDGFQGLYVNGTLVASSSSTVTMGSTASTTPQVSNGNTFDGSIPIAKIYNRCLTEDEVLRNYNAYKNRFNI